MISTLYALILGAVEGFTEFLPISSTAHLMIVAKILGVGQSEFVKTFEIAIQSGAILAVIAIYWRKFLDLEILKKIAVAFIPTGIIGLALYKIVKTYFIGNIILALSVLGIGGILLIMFEKYMAKNTAPFENRGAGAKTITYRNAVFVGVAQAVAIIPGVSRSAATIIGGLFLGIDRETIVEFSFLLAVPTILSATILDLVKNFGSLDSGQGTALTLGFIASFATATMGIKFLLSCVRRKSFAGFGWYRIILAIIFLTIWI